MRLINGQDNVLLNSSKIFFNNSPYGICLIRVDGTILNVNRSLMSILKTKSKSNIIGNNIINLIAEDYKKKAAGIFKRFLRTGKTRIEEIKLITQSNVEIWVECNLTFHIDKASKEKYIVQYIRNIDYRKNLELSLAATNLKFRTLYENMNIGLYQTTLKGEVLFANKAFAKILNIKSKREFKEININDLSELINYPRKKFINILKKNRKVVGFEVEIKTKTGKVKYIRENAQGIYDNKNRLIGIEGSVEDITEKVITHRKLMQSEKSYKGLFNSIKEAVYVQDRDGKFLDVNDGALKMYGYPKKSFIGNTPAFLSAPNKNDFLKLSLQIAAAFRGIPQEFEFWGMRKNGDIFPKSVRLYKTQYFDQEAIIALAQDISERKEFIDKLKYSELQYKTLFETNPNPMWIYDLETYRFLNVNQAAISHYGYSKKEFMKMTIKDIRPSEDIKSLIESVSNISEGFTSPHIWRHIKKNGEVIFVEISSHTLDYFGRKAELILSYDVTERLKNSEQNQKLSEALEQSSAIVIITNVNGQIEYVNKKFAEVTGYSKEEVIGKYPNILKYTDAFSVDRQNVWQTITKGKIWKGEFVNRKKNGEKFYVSALISPIKDKNSKIISFFAIEEDITLLKIQAKKIDEYQKLLKGFGFAIQKLLTVKDYEISLYETLEMLGKSVDADRAYIFKNYFDEKKSEVYANQIYEWTKDGIEPQIDNPLLQNLSYKKFGIEIESIDLDSTFVFSRENVSQAFSEMMLLLAVKSFILIPIKVNDKFWGFLGFDSSDEESKWNEEDKHIFNAAAISIGKAIERELIKNELIVAKNDAQKADKLKTEFLAQMSHEIRSPLNIILNYLSLLKENYEKVSDPDIIDMFNGIETAGNRIIRTIDLILNLAELQTNSYDLQIKKLDLIDDVLRLLVYEYKHNAIKKGLKLEFKQSTNDTIINADEYSITQVFANLLDNAIKYSDSGRVLITVRRNEIDKLAVDIEDTGIGISEEYLPNLFKPFRQEEQGYSRKYDGNGLGLSLVKRYCELNNAEINVESTKGKGTKFTVTFN